MKRINCKSGFSIFEFEHDLTIPFVFKYNTKGGLNPYIVSYDGTNWVNCAPQKDGSLKIMVNGCHKLKAGELLCERKWDIQDADFVGGKYPIVDTRTTGIELTYDVTVSTTAVVSVPLVYQRGLTGLSAYEEYCKQYDYTGSVTEWLELIEKPAKDAAKETREATTKLQEAIDTANEAKAGFNTLNEEVTAKELKRDADEEARALAAQQQANAFALMQGVIAGKADKSLINDYNISRLTGEKYATTELAVEAFMSIFGGSELFKGLKLKYIGTDDKLYCYEYDGTKWGDTSLLVSVQQIGQSLINDTLSWDDGIYIHSNGAYSTDATYSLSDYIRVREGAKLKIIRSAANYYAIAGFTAIGKKINVLDNGGTSEVYLTIPEGINFIKVSQKTSQKANIKVEYSEPFDNTVKNFAFNDAIDNIDATLKPFVYKKGIELITPAIVSESDNNVGFIASGGSIASDSSYRYTPLIRVYKGSYTAGAAINGGAAICAYDKKGKYVRDLIKGSIGDGKIDISGRDYYIKMCTRGGTGYLSLVPDDDLYNVADADIVTKLFDNYKNSEDNLRDFANITSGIYSHKSRVEIPLVVRRPTAISFRFRINEDVNIADAVKNICQLKFSDDEKIDISLVEGVNTLYQLTSKQDSWVSYDYYACTPKYASGFKVEKTVGGTTSTITNEIRNLTRKQPLVGMDAFMIRYKGTLNDTIKGTSVRITSSNLEIFKGETIIAQFEIKPTEGVKELTDRLKAATVVGGSLENYEVKTFYTERRTQSELLQVNEIRIADLYYYATDSWGAYIPYAIDEKWHTCEIYMDNMRHRNPAYTTLYQPTVIVSIDGVQSVITSATAMFGEAILTINKDVADINIRDISIQDGQVDGYERLNDPTVAAIASKYSKQIVGLMGHYMMETEYGSDEITNSGYDYDGSTDRLTRMKRLADKAGYKYVTIQQVADYYDGLIDLPNKCFFLIFDDIEINLWTDRKLRNYFTKLGIKPSLALVNSGTYTDGSQRPEHDNIDVEAFYDLTPNAIRDMRANGWIPHMHGFTHSQVDAFSYANFVT